MKSSANQKENKENKRYGILAWVTALYSPIIFWILVVNLPKLEWKYVLESNKTRVTRRHQKAKEIGLPGIPYWRNSGSAAILYLNEDGTAYAMCGPDFFCSEELNAKKGINFIPISGGSIRIKSNVIFAADNYWCDSYDINSAGKCRSYGWEYGER
tara:strand:+ start:205 stop:672 length:468 start_codon:yes stop_codon:yes gene_type:complete